MTGVEAGPDLQFFPFHNHQDHDHNQREDAADQHTGLQIITGLLGDRTDQARAKTTAEITGHRQQGKHSRTALR